MLSSPSDSNLPVAERNLATDSPAGSVPPVGTAIQVAADSLVFIIQEERESAIRQQKEQLKHLENAFSEYRRQQEKALLQLVWEKKQLFQQIERLKAANHGSNASSTSRIQELESLVALLRTEGDQLRSRINATTADSAVALNQLGIYNPQPGVFAFGKNWPELLNELGLDGGKPWSAADLDNCMFQTIQRLRQSRSAAQPPPCPQSAVEAECQVLHAELSRLKSYVASMETQLAEMSRPNATASTPRL